MFKKARIKLTAWYLVLIMFVTLLFSSIIYTGITNSAELALKMHEDRINNRLNEFKFRNGPPPPAFQQPISAETVEQIKQDVFSELYKLNLAILLGAGVLGYFLAGRTLKPIEEMTKKQKTFVADAAHELKTPLTSMKTNLEVTLLDKKLKIADAKQVLEDILEDVESLSQLTNVLLKESKYQNTEKVVKEPVDMQEVIDKVIKKLQPKITQKELTITQNIQNTLIEASEPAIEELITIILDNAIKFSNNKQEISINLQKHKKSVTIKIKDEGVGIDKKDIPHIFERFYKAEGSRTKSNHDGYGLGLAIAKEIVIRHKGKIYVTSEKNKGTTFEIILPIS